MSDHECQHCGQWHGKLCPQVKAIEYHPDGRVKRIEYVTSADFGRAPLPMPLPPGYVLPPPPPPWIPNTPVFTTS